MQFKLALKVLFLNRVPTQCESIGHNYSNWKLSPAEFFQRRTCKVCGFTEGAKHLKRKSPAYAGLPP